MKPHIHPRYDHVVFRDESGNLVAAGQIEKFQRRYGRDPRSTQ